MLEEHHPGGATTRLGGFPPVHGQFGWQGALVHAGLRSFERELVASDLGWSGDWFDSSGCSARACASATSSG